MTRRFILCTSSHAALACPGAVALPEGLQVPDPLCASAAKPFSASTPDSRRSTVGSLLSPLQCPLTQLDEHKPFRIRTYKKGRGVGGTASGQSGSKSLLVEARRALKRKSSGPKLFAMSKCTARTQENRLRKCLGMRALQSMRVSSPLESVFAKDLGRTPALPSWRGVLQVL